MILGTEYDELEASSDTLRVALRSERLILAVTQALCRAVAEGKFTQAELARRLGKSESHVSQLLGGGKNMTLRTVAAIATALEMDIEISLRSEKATFRSIVQFPIEDWKARPVILPAQAGLEEGAA